MHPFALDALQVMEALIQRGLDKNPQTAQEIAALKRIFDKLVLQKLPAIEAGIVTQYPLQSFLPRSRQENAAILPISQYAVLPLSCRGGCIRITDQC
jgi:hypothetical protein